MSPVAEDGNPSRPVGVRPATVARLAWRDLATEPVLALCSTVTVSAMLAPIVVLAGLQAGVMGGLRHALLEDPHAREITTVANRSFAADPLSTIASRSDVAFLVPRTRALAASVLLQLPGATGEARRVELVPTAAGDPLLGSDPTPGIDDLTLSASAAAALHVVGGTKLEARVARLVAGKQDVVVVPMTVTAVAAPAVTVRDAAFVTLGFSLSGEAFQEGDAAWSNGSAIEAPASFAGFRLYARRLDQVPALDAALRGMGIDVASRAGDVAGLLALDRHLSILFLLVASLGAVGFLVSLGAGLWANVERKRRSLALLRFTGLPTASLLLLPLLQSVVLATLGSAAGLAAAYGVSVMINEVFSGTLPAGQPLCTVTPLLAGSAVLATVAGAVMAAFFAAYRATRVQAWEGVAGA